MSPAGACREGFRRAPFETLERAVSRIHSRPSRRRRTSSDAKLRMVELNLDFKCSINDSRVPTPDTLTRPPGFDNRSTTSLRIHSRTTTSSAGLAISTPRLGYLEPFESSRSSRIPRASFSHCQALRAVGYPSIIGTRHLLQPPRLSLFKFVDQGHRLFTRGEELLHLSPPKGLGTRAEQDYKLCSPLGDDLPVFYPLQVCCFPLHNPRPLHSI